jgi:HlyD family secretion protein
VPAAPTPGDDWRASLRAAGAVIFATFGLMMLWAALSRLDGAVVAPGVVAVESSRQVIQHLEGGIVSEIRVRDGDRVQRGDVLFRLENATARSHADTLQLQSLALQIREARLLAERDRRPALIVPPALQQALAGEGTMRALADETESFRQRQEHLSNQLKLLQKRSALLEIETRNWQSEQEATRQQLVFVDQELTGLRTLFRRQLVPLARVAAMEKERVRLEATLARAAAEEAKARGLVTEVDLQMTQTETQFQQSVASDLVDTRRALADVQERVNAALDTVRRLDITAPMSGIAQSRKVSTRGAVVRAGDTLVEIAPVEAGLVVLAQINPNDVDAIGIGMRSELRFPTFKAAEAPVIFGVIKSVSNDRVLDPGQAPYFAAEIVAEVDDLPPDVKARLRPGQNAEVIISTGERSALSYLVQPITDRLRSAMRER